MIKLSHLSSEYLKTTVTAPSDPTSKVVEFAFTAHNTDPVTADWKAGSWEPGSWSSSRSTAVARVHVGPLGVVTLAENNVYHAWLRVTDTVERPVVQFDQVVVY